MRIALGKAAMQSMSWFVGGVGFLCAALLVLVLISLAFGATTEGFVVPLLSVLSVLLLGMAWLFRRISRRADAADHAN